MGSYIPIQIFVSTTRNYIIACLIGFYKVGWDVAPVDWSSPLVSAVDQQGPPPPGAAPFHGSSFRADVCPTDNPINYGLSQRARRIEKNQIHSYMAANLWL